MKRVPFYEVQRYNPVRSVDWRWQRAMQLTEASKRRDSVQDDHETLTAVEYIKASNRCRTNEDQAHLTVQMPATALARAINIGKSAQRIEIQSRFLAGQAPAEIADLLGLSLAAVDMYEALFYNVRDRLEAECYIFGAAIGWRALRPSHDGMDAETILKMVGYFGGPHVLDVALPMLLNKGPMLERFDGTLAEDAANARQRAEMLFSAMRRPLAAKSAIRMTLLQNLLDRACPRPRATDGVPKEFGLLVDCGRFLSAPSVSIVAPSSPPAERHDPVTFRHVA